MKGLPSIVFDGTQVGQRYTVLVDGEAVYLTFAVFKVLLHLAHAFVTRLPMSITFNELMPGDDRVARQYLYRAREEIRRQVKVEWDIVTREIEELGKGHRVHLILRASEVVVEPSLEKHDDCQIAQWARDILMRQKNVMETGKKVTRSRF